MNPNDNEDIQPLSAEEIKAIGEIEMGPSRHEVFLNNHYKKLLWGGIALGVLGGGIIAFCSHLHDVKQEAAGELMTALKVENGVVDPASFDDAALARLSSEFASTPSHATAELLAGLKELTGSAPQAGVERLERLASGGEVHPLLRARAQAAVATYHMGQGDAAKAAEAWQRVTALGDSPYLALAYLTLGDLARTAGETDKARDYYAQAETKCETSPLVTGKTVQMHRLLLDVDAPRRVEAPAADKPHPLDDPFAEPIPGESKPDEDPLHLRS
ncbi:MAG: tetratricopeptide repeat protein [Akkermansia sp.]